MKNITPKKLYFADKNNCKILQGNEITKETVGCKAFGLSAIYSSWTLPFFVISSEMFEMYYLNRDINKIKEYWGNIISEIAKLSNVNLSEELFIRSNTCKEDLSERGRFESYISHDNNFYDIIKKYFDEMIEKYHYKEGIPLLIQQHSQILGKGHISNERRVSKEPRDWKGEFENESLYSHKSIYEPFIIPLRNWRRKIVVNNAQPLRCFSLANIKQVLELPCAWATNHLYRLHFEWIFNGDTVYIVQADEEQAYGVNPMIQANDVDDPNGSHFNPKVLHLLKTKDEKKYHLYSKVKNPLIYKKLGMQTAPIYIFDNIEEIKNLKKGIPSEKLIQDIKTLTKRPLVIRTDLRTDDQEKRQMLPRTDDIRDFKSAMKWLSNTANALYQKYNDNKIPFVFILHNFIPAYSSAFAYAEPNSRKVLIESLWGVPEGLYYYSHDKYVVDTIYKEFSDVNLTDITILDTTIKAKTNFVFPQSDGKWKCEQVSPDYIWKPAIPNKNWIKEIAFNTRKIAENVGEGVSVMWFVGVNNETYKCNVFPWHHEAFTYDPKHRNRPKNKSDIDFTIKKSVDIEKLREITKENKLSVKYILFRPIEEIMLRNKELIEDIGNLAKSIDAVIILEGGVLSHAYYQLVRTGAAITPRNAFNDTIQNVDHDKLVRDKIPDKIKNSGELATTRTLPEDEFFEQLKIKLVEEAFEVLETTDTKSLVQEIADVLEVIDAIIHKKSISMDDISTIKDKKKHKVGGFDEGVVLEKTAFPLYKSVKDIKDAKTTKHGELTSWTDKKQRGFYNETIKRLKIPITLKTWGTQLTATGFNNRPDINVILKGNRINNSYQIEISISEGFEQLSLFENE